MVVSAFGISKIPPLGIRPCLHGSRPSSSVVDASDSSSANVENTSLRYPQLGDSILEAREITPETQEALRQAIAEFKTNATVKVGAA